jgi:hypothetical protein
MLQHLNEIYFLRVAVTCSDVIGHFFMCEFYLFHADDSL